MKKQNSDRHSTIGSDARVRPAKFALSLTGSGSHHRSERFFEVTHTRTITLGSHLPVSSRAWQPKVD